MKITLQTANMLSALLSDLEENFPNNIPINTYPSIEEFRRLQGQQEVIQFIRNLLDDGEDQEDADLID